MAPMRTTAVIGLYVGQSILSSAPAWAMAFGNDRGWHIASVRGTKSTQSLLEVKRTFVLYRASPSHH
jgi:hypothetical protein